jgi:hypothetical protein
VLEQLDILGVAGVAAPRRPEDGAAVGMVEMPNDVVRTPGHADAPEQRRFPDPGVVFTAPTEEPLDQASVAVEKIGAHEPHSADRAARHRTQHAHGATIVEAARAGADLPALRFAEVANLRKREQKVELAGAEFLQRLREKVVAEQEVGVAPQNVLPARQQTARVERPRLVEGTGRGDEDVVGVPAPRRVERDGFASQLHDDRLIHRRRLTQSRQCRRQQAQAASISERDHDRQSVRLCGGEGKLARENLLIHAFAPLQGLTAADSRRATDARRTTVARPRLRLSPARGEGDRLVDGRLPESAPLRRKIPVGLQPGAVGATRFEESRRPGFDQVPHHGFEVGQGSVQERCVGPARRAVAEHAGDLRQQPDAVHDRRAAGEPLEAVAVVAARDALVDDDMGAPFRRQRVGVAHLPVAHRENLDRGAPGERLQDPHRRLVALAVPVEPMTRGEGFVSPGRRVRDRHDPGEKAGSHSGTGFGTILQPSNSGSVA